jgi:hypothetical protein
MHYTKRRIVCLLAISLATLVRAAPREGPEPMERIRALGLASIPGAMLTFYSPHAKRRARHLQSVLSGEIVFYSELFHTAPSPIALGVLNADQWSKVVEGTPFGMPSLVGNREAVFVMPASWSDVAWISFANREIVPPQVLKKALANGKSWEQIIFEGADGIGAHEIGHSVIIQIDVDPQTHWLDEYLASYAGYAYLKAKHPSEALALEIFWSQGLDSPHPMTKLHDFDSQYEEIIQTAPANYGWYQTVFAQRVMEVYRTEGVQFLRTIRSAFPKNGAHLNTSQVLEQLEALSPGWKDRAAQLEAGNVKAVDLMTIVKL